MTVSGLTQTLFTDTYTEQSDHDRNEDEKGGLVNEMDERTEGVTLVELMITLVIFR